MSCSNFIILAIFIPSITAINVTNLGNQQEISNMKNDLSMLWNMISSLNTSVQTVTEMNATIETQRQEMALMNATIHAQQQEIKNLRSSLNSSRENNTATNRMLSEVDEKVNKNYGAYQLIIQDLVTNFNTLRNTSKLQLSHMNESLGSLASQIHYTSLSFFDAQKMLTALENASKETEKNMTSTWNKLMSYENEIQDLRSETKKNMSSSWNELMSNRKEIQDLRSDVTKTISFTVSKSSSLTNSNNMKIIYDKVITNIGDAYSNKTGIFTCTLAGTYVFTWSTMSNSDTQYCFSNIYHNGNRLLMSYSYNANGGYNEVASNTIVLSLMAGDRVWIQTETGTYCYGYPYTGFSGWKI